MQFTLSSFFFFVQHPIHFPFLCFPFSFAYNWRTRFEVNSAQCDQRLDISREFVFWSRLIQKLGIFRVFGSAPPVVPPLCLLDSEPRLDSTIRHTIEYKSCIQGVPWLRSWMIPLKWFRALEEALGWLNWSTPLFWKHSNFNEKMCDF